MEIIFENETFFLDKIIQFENIHRSKNLECACGSSSSSLFYGKPTPIGFCETNEGFMSVFECPDCGEKYRCHIDSEGRYNIDVFKQDIGLILFNRKHK